MDDLEVRIPKEITEYHEKFYGLTLRQILATLAIAAINIPLYINLSAIIGDDLASYIVIAIAGIIGFFGFIKIHNLDAEKIVPFWWRNYISFAKPLIYKTEKEIAAEKEAKKHKNKKKDIQVENATSEIDTSNAESKPLSTSEIRNQQKLFKQQEKEKKRQEKIEAQRIIREEKEHKKQLKAKRKAQRELEEAKRMFGVLDEEPKHTSSALNEDDLVVLKELAQAFGKEKKNVQQKEENS